MRALANGALRAVVLIVGLTTAADGSEIQAEAELDSASMRCDGEVFTVTTGKLERQWSWSKAGWRTTAITDLASGHRWPLVDRNEGADWQIPGLDGEGQLMSVTANESTDEGFTSPHLEVVSTVHYPEVDIDLQHIVWIYPDAPGLRTQIRLRSGANHRSATRDRPTIRVIRGSAFDAAPTQAVGDSGIVALVDHGRTRGRAKDRGIRPAGALLHWGVLVGLAGP